MVFQRAGEYADRDKAVSFLVVAFAIAVVVCILMLYFIIPVYAIFTPSWMRKPQISAFLWFFPHLLHAHTGS